VKIFLGEVLLRGTLGRAMPHNPCTMRQIIHGFLAIFVCTAPFVGANPAWALDPSDRGRLDAAVLEELMTTVSCSPQTAPRVCGDFRDQQLMTALTRITFTDSLAAAFEAFPGAVLSSYGKVGRDFRIAITASSLSAAELTPPCFSLLLKDLEKKARALLLVMNQKNYVGKPESTSHREGVELVLLSIAGARATLCGT
jgi:hypothetical protein